MPNEPINWSQIVVVSISAVSFFTVVVGWFIRLERRLSGKLTREEHIEVCEKHQSAVTVALRELQKDMEERDEKANKFRETAQDKLTDIMIKLSPVEVRISQVEKDLQGIRDWKHVVVDPFVPRAIEEHERRLNRMESVK